MPRVFNGLTSSLHRETFTILDPQREGSSKKEGRARGMLGGDRGRPDSRLSRIPPPIYPHEVLSGCPADSHGDDATLPELNGETRGQKAARKTKAKRLKQRRCGGVTKRRGKRPEKEAKDRRMRSRRRRRRRDDEISDPEIRLSSRFLVSLLLFAFPFANGAFLQKIHSRRAVVASTLSSLSLLLYPMRFPT